MQRMEDLTRADLDVVDARASSLGSRPLRPRDAATLILVDRSGSEHLVLMGRRHRRHKFMPGSFVFPGGRTDPADSRIAVANDLHPHEQAKLVGSPPRLTAARAKAIALSAIRETYEEAGLLIGREGPFSSRSPHWQGFVANRVCPSLQSLRFIARAITPPGRVRRFDTRFFAVWRSQVAVELAECPTDELEEIAWVPIRSAMELDIPTVTRTVLDDLAHRLEIDPELAPGQPVPFYFVRGKRVERVLL